jgi:AraC-like DNA-binding protein
METYSTANRTASTALGYWNDVLERKLAVPIAIRPLHRVPLSATLRVENLGSSLLAETVSSAACIEHSSRHVARTDRRSFSLMMCMSGDIHVSQYGQRIRMIPGDFVLQDSHAPCRISFGETNRAISLNIAEETMRRFLPAPDDFCGRRVDGSSGLGRVVSRMLPAIWMHVAGGLPPQIGEAVEKNLLEMVATTYASRVSRERFSSGGRVRASHIKRMLETRLREPGLSAGAVAHSLRISTRYVHRLFAAEHETISEYILRRRLEEAAERLRSPLWNGRATSEIASDWGFASAAHFSRSFRSRFGRSPTEYRKLQTSAPSETRQLARPHSGA